MQNLKIKFENCYGIRSLEHTFCFDDKRANLIYASNGTMKSSFAKTFCDFSEGKESKDEIYGDRPNQREIEFDSREIKPEEVFVIKPYQESYKSERISTLLVNKELKNEYEEILKDLEQKTDELIKHLKAESGIKNIEAEFSNSIMQEEGEFMKALIRVRDEVQKEDNSKYSDIKYEEIFNEKVSEFLEKKENIESLTKYTEKYKALLEGSQFFKDGVFNHYQAGEIAKQLKNNGFFSAEHSLFLRSNKKIETEEELKKVIQEEMDTILDNKDLQEFFKEMDKQIQKNKQLRTFADLLKNKPDIIPELINMRRLSQKLWKYYLASNKDLFNDWCEQYQSSKEGINKIYDQADQEISKWVNVLEIFNERFSVPFKLHVENNSDAIIGRDAPKVVFTFNDDVENSEGKRVEEKNLLDVLSQGEKRALYLLNIIFEIEGRKDDSVKTLFIIDDIADSFDYKNKYAIIEYLNDVLEVENFRQIILTHNYDFYRTVWKRLDLNKCTFQVHKSRERINIMPENMYQTPLNKWIKSGRSLNELIAMIPFVRNVSEYTNDGDTKKVLTNILHIMEGEEEISIDQLEELFAKIIKGYEVSSGGSSDKVRNVIFQQADKIKPNASGNPLEEKIVLAIAIRLRAEIFMFEAIKNSGGKTDDIGANQTAKLLKIYKNEFSKSKNKHQILHKVLLMTPESIHLNSFAYEPIIDMSADHLIQLYEKIKNLKSLSDS